MRRIFPVYALIFLFSCGIEDYIYLDPIPSSNVTHPSGNTVAIVTLPRHSTPPAYFTHYVIFYRIYISDANESAEITNPVVISNSTLTSHYNTLSPYADETNNVSASQVGSVFNNLLYSELAVSGTNIQSLLVSSSVSRSLTIEFASSAPSGNVPYITITSGGVTSPPYPLRRNWTVRGYSPPSGAPSTFTPLPTSMPLSTSIGYNFTRSEDLCGTNNNNWDISTKTGTSWSSGTGQYAYVSLYIAARGMDQNFNSIYSRPTFLGILRLPD